MSDIIEKTLSSLPRLLSENLISSISGTQQNLKTRTVSKGFENFTRAVGASRTKYEEEHIVKRELSLLQQRFTQPSVTPTQMKEYMVRIIYCQMMGYDVSFACIHAVKLAQQGALQEKRTGYLAASLLLHEEHELILLLINTIQKDLNSSNLLENCMGLMAVCQLVNTEMVPMLLPSVIDKLRHPRDIVRKKAVMCLQKFHLRAPDLVQHLTDKFRASLCDKDPGVMSVALHVYLQLAKEDGDQIRDMAQGFINTLTQVISRKLPPDYEYHGVPAPWLQIKLLKILAALGAQNERTSSLMYTVLSETLSRATIKDNSAFAILYECVVTITSIWPNPELLHTAAGYVGKFLRSKSNNLKYAGLKALGHLVQAGPEFVLQYQMIVVECLDDPDAAIQRKTYDLLYSMTNQTNVAVVCKKLMGYLLRTTDSFMQSDLVSKVTDLITRFAPSRQWYVESMNELIEVSGDHAHYQATRALIYIIREGCEDNNSTESGKLIEYVVNTYRDYIRRAVIPPRLLHVAVWVLGEYIHRASTVTIDQDNLVSSLLHHYQQSLSAEDSQNYILTGLYKLFINEVIPVEMAQGIVGQLESYTKGNNLKQRLQELRRLTYCDRSIHEKLKSSNGHKTMQVDLTLSFLDDYVSEALEGGAPVYKSRQARLMDTKKLLDVKSIFGDLRYDMYSSPVGSQGESTTAGRVEARPLEGSTGGGSPLSGSMKNETREVGLNMAGVRRVWGKDGIQKADSNMGQQTEGTSSNVGHPEASYSAVSIDSQKTVGDEEGNRRQELAMALFSGLDSSSSRTSTSTQKTCPGQASWSEMKTTSQESLKHTGSRTTSKPGQIPGANSVQTPTLLIGQKPKDGHDWRTFRGEIAAAKIKSEQSVFSSEKLSSAVNPEQSDTRKMSQDSIKAGDTCSLDSFSGTNQSNHGFYLMPDPSGWLNDGAEISSGQMGSRVSLSDYRTVHTLSDSQMNIQTQAGFHSESIEPQSVASSIYEQYMGEPSSEDLLHISSQGIQEQQQSKDPT